MVAKILSTIGILRLRSIASRPRSAQNDTWRDALSTQQLAISTSYLASGYWLLTTGYCFVPPIIFFMPFQRSRKTYDGESLYEYAVGALARQMRTVAEIKRLMRNRVKEQEHGELLVEMVVARLKEQKYLNDTSYAENYSRFRKENEKFGRLRVIQDLKIKGVHGDIIDSVVSAAYGDVNEEHLARQFLQRKRIVKPEGRKQAARVFRTLMRAGFSSRIIFRILKKWDVDDETLSALEEEASGQ